MTTRGVLASLANFILTVYRLLCRSWAKSTVGEVSAVWENSFACSWGLSFSALVGGGTVAFGFMSNFSVLLAGNGDLISVRSITTVLRNGASSLVAACGS